MQCMLSIADLLSYYQDGQFTEVSVRNPRKNKLLYSRMLSEFASEIAQKNQNLTKPS
jgi:hypothetical protein